MGNGIRRKLSQNKKLFGLSVLGGENLRLGVKYGELYGCTIR